MNGESTVWVEYRGRRATMTIVRILAEMEAGFAAWRILDCRHDVDACFKQYLRIRVCWYGTKSIQVVVSS